MKKWVTRSLYNILALIMIISMMILFPGIKAKADPGPGKILISIKDSDVVLNEYNSKGDISAYRGKTVSFDLKFQEWESLGGKIYDPYVSDGVVVEGLVSDSSKVVVNNDKKTITIAKDAPKNVKLYYAYRVYDSKNSKYTDDFNSYDNFGPYVTLNIYDKNELYNYYFMSQIEMITSKGLVAGGSTVLSTKWNGSSSIKPSNIKFTTSDKMVSISKSKLSVKSSVVKDATCTVKVSAKLAGVSVSTECNVDVYAKYRFISESNTSVLKLGKTATIKSYFMQRKATKKGVKEKKSNIKKTDKVTYKSSNKKVAAVSKKGKITAAVNKVGSSDITVTVVRKKKKYTVSFSVNVEEGNVNLSSTNVKKPSKNGKKIMVACWNDEIKQRFDFILKSYPEYKDMVQYTIVPTDDDGYRKYLKDMETGKAPVADIILSEADYIDFTLGLNYVVPVSSIGYKESWYSNAYPYTKQIGTKDGKLYALAWQACPSAFIYNKSIARSVFGTADSSVIQTKVKDWDAFLETAKKLKSKDMRILSSSDIFRQYVGGSSSHVTSGKNIYLGGVVEKYLNYNKKLVTECNVPSCDLWSEEWSKGFYDNITFGYFGPGWFYDFCMGSEDPSSVMAKNGWGICEGPSDSFWGGTWIIPTNSGKNNELVAFLLNKLTADSKMMKKINDNSADYVNNMAVNASIIKSTASKPSERERYKVYDKIAKKIPAKHESKYYEVVCAALQSASRDYSEGNINNLSNTKSIVSKAIKMGYPEVNIILGGTGKKAKKNAIKSYEVELPKKGDIVLTNDKNGVYVVTKVTKKAVVSVSYLRPLNITATKVAIPDTVKLSSGNKVKVVGISKNAFKGCKKLKKITIGKNVSSIGANAFNGTNAVKTVVIKSGSIKSVGKKAFVGMNVKAKIKCPANKVKIYAKLFKKAGLATSVTVSK